MLDISALSFPRLMLLTTNGLEVGVTSTRYLW